MEMTRGRLAAAAVLAFAAWAATAALQRRVFQYPLNWDESDYIRAAALDLRANAFDQGSLSLRDYARFARAKWRREPPPLPPGYEESLDPVELRHFHPPLVFYLARLLRAHRSLPRLRAVERLGQLALAAAIFHSYLTLTPAATAAGMLGTFLMTLMVLPISAIHFNTHTWFAALALSSMSLLSRWLRDQDTRSGLACCLLLSSSLLTLVTGFVVWAAAFGLALLDAFLRARAGEDGRALLKRVAAALALCLLLTTLLWPAFLFNLSLFRTIALYLYAALRSTHMYTGAGALRPAIFTPLLAPLLLGAGAGLWHAWRLRDRWREWAPFLAFALVYFAVIVKTQHVTHYYVTVAAPLIALVGSLIDRWRPRAAAAVLLLAAGAAAATVRPIDHQIQILPEDLEWLRGELRGKSVYADTQPVLRYYFGESYDLRYVFVQPSGESVLKERTGGAYADLPRPRIEGFSVVVMATHRGYLDRPEARAYFSACRKRERETVTLFECPAPAAPARPRKK